MITQFTPSHISQSSSYFIVGIFTKFEDSLITLSRTWDFNLKHPIAYLIFKYEVLVWLAFLIQSESGKWIWLLIVLDMFFIPQVFVMSRVQVPKTERIRRPQQCKSMKGFYFQLELGFPPHPTQWSGARSPEPRFTAVIIGLEQRQRVGKGWLAAGVS